jgi:DNA-binding NarL/FixJ family response regulator
MIDSDLSKKIKVFHIEDYQIMRDGIRTLLSQTDDIEVIGEQKDGRDLSVVFESEPIDVVILDIYLDAMEDFSVPNGFEICQWINEKFPTVKVLAHSAYDDADRVANILKAGAAGFVSKKAGFDELVGGIREVYSGKRFICSQTASKLRNLNEFLSGLDQTLKSKEEIFSVREREVLQLLANGYSSKQISQALFITERTVESHRKNLVEKAEVKNTVELIAYASSLGLIKK